MLYNVVYFLFQLIFWFFLNFWLIFQGTWMPASLKLTLQTCGFLSFEKDKACQSILIILRGKTALS